MSAADKAALQAAGNAYNSAKTQAEKDAAHAQAESIRAKYGYSGGSDGSQFIQIGSVEVPEIVSPSYDSALQALLAANKKAPANADAFGFHGPVAVPPPAVAHHRHWRRGLRNLDLARFDLRLLVDGNEKKAVFDGCLDR